MEATTDQTSVEGAVAERILEHGTAASERPYEEYDFLHSAAEDRALLGVSNPTKPDIPNTVHFVYGLAPSGRELPYIVYLAIRTAQESLKPDAIKLHHTYLEASSTYAAKLVSSGVQLVHHTRASLFAETDPHRGDADASLWNVAHLADLLRLNVLDAEGGIYLDSDVFTLRPFDSVRRSAADVVLGFEGGNRHGLCNAIIMARPGASFLKRWRASYVDFVPTEWNEHSVVLPRRLAEENPGEVDTLPPEAFFWPTWTERHVRYMHEPLGLVERDTARHSLEANSGSFWPCQLAYHAWNQLAGKYLKKLDASKIREEDTRFNLMARRFVEDE